MNEKRIFFTAAVHGDEPIGHDILQELSGEGRSIDWEIGNVQAFQDGVRDVGVDLNRCAPGLPESDTYEMRRAAELVARANSYDYYVDLHGSHKPTGVFLILGRPSEEQLQFASHFDVDRVVWFRPDPQTVSGTLMAHHPKGVAIESGCQAAPSIRAKLKSTVESLLDADLADSALWKERLEKKELYIFEGTIQDHPKEPLAEFQPFTWKGETFHALFVGSHDGAVAYKLCKVDLETLIEAGRE